ncbi:MAG: Fe-S cluster assembly protein SufD [Acidimicrobiales bacterium]|nr:MAG: Fe-S cluster assembly protein SufD [Acidimicrobiales bacterium]
MIVNGAVDPDRSQLGDPLAGVHLSTLVDARSEHPERLAPHLPPTTDDADAFLALNIAYGSDGAVIYVAGGHAVDAPIHVVHIALPDETHNVSCSGVVIRLDDGASATVVETSLGDGDHGGTNTRTTIALGEGSTLSHIVVQDVEPTQVHLGRIAVTQGSRSAFRSHWFNLGGTYGRLVCDVRLAGEEASADLSGLYFGRGSQTLDQQITVTHAAPNCTSRQRFRGVLDDQSTGVFNGGIDVRPGADGTDAQQSNDNLLLSDRAEANTQPRLEILADDVTCKHGATVGQLDDNALYYLRSRGIDEPAARRLLIHGFADEAVEAVDNEVLRAWITERLGHADA